MPLPLTVSCFTKIQIGFTFLVPANLGSPGKRAVKHTRARARAHVCVCVYKLQCEKFAKICNKDSLFLYAKKSL